jgi:glutathione S-transferase
MMEVVHHRATGGTVDGAMQARCDRAFSSAIDTLADRLAGREWLVGDRMTAADVTTAPVLHRVRSSSLLAVPDRVREIDRWADRVLAYDRLLDRRTT